MEDGLILLCKFGNGTLVLKFQLCRCFDDLVRALCDNWSCLDPNNIQITYSIPGHSSCFLRDDDELSSMLSLVSVFGLKFVDVFVNVSGAPTLSYGNTILPGECSEVQVQTCDDTVCMITDKVVDNHTLSISDANFNDPQCSSSGERGLLTSNWLDAISHVGQVFKGGVKEFRFALCRFSVEAGFKFSFVKNNKEKVSAVRSEKYSRGCIWYIYRSVSKADGYFRIKKYANEHTCGVVFSDRDTNRLTFSHIAELIFDQFRVNPGLSAKGVVGLFWTSYGLDIPYIKAWRAVEKAKGMIFGDSTESFKLLRWYIRSAMTYNPHSHISLDVDCGTNRFRRLFVSFRACIRGFEFCRPMLFMDGTFLKGRYKGVILSAIGKDGNQGLYPLAFSVVDSETEDNWRWFLSELRVVVGCGRIINFVSDRNAGLLEALPSVFPNGNHFFCLQHLKRNLRDKFCGSTFTNAFREHLVWLFRQCAHAPSEIIFREKLDEFKRVGGSTVERFLDGLPFENWTNAYAKGCRYGEMSSNAVESFNACLLEVRDLPITHLIDRIRIKLMEWFSERRQLASGWNGSLCPKMVDKLNAFVNEGRTWYLRRCSDTIFEVFSTPSVTVDVGRRTCSCCYWQITGFPCVHATVAIFRCNLKVEDMVEHYFHVVAYKKLYEDFIHPIPSLQPSECLSLNELDIIAPQMNRPSGRPRKRRFRSRGEVVRRIKCGRCGKIGSHNRKTCKEPLR